MHDSVILVVKVLLNRRFDEDKPGVVSRNGVILSVFTTAISGVIFSVRFVSILLDKQI